MSGQPVRAAALPHLYAAATRDLTAADFFGYQNSASFVSGDKADTVAHDHYARALILKSCGSSDPQLRTNVSLNARHFPGFKYITFTIGVSDSDYPNTQATFTATADGQTVFRATLHHGRIAQRVTLALGQTGVFNLYAVETQGVCANVVVGEPTVTVARPSVPLPAPARSPRSLTRDDFYGYQNDASFLNHDSTVEVGGDRYDRAIDLHSCGSSDPQLRSNVSLHTGRVRGYRSITFNLGISDTENPGTQATFAVATDGRTVYKTALTQNRIAKPVSFAIGKTGVFNFYAVETKGVCAHVIVGNPTAQP